jgi:hypothetical protein
MGVPCALTRKKLPTPWPPGERGGAGGLCSADSHTFAATAPGLHQQRAPRIDMPPRGRRCGLGARSTGGRCAISSVRLQRIFARRDTPEGRLGAAGSSWECARREIPQISATAAPRSWHLSLLGAGGQQRFTAPTGSHWLAANRRVWEQGYYSARSPRAPRVGRGWETR